MPKKKVEKAKAEGAARAKKRTTAQKKVAKALKKPARAPKTTATGEVRLSKKEQTTPTASPKFALPTEVPPQLRKAYKQRFEEAQLEEIGKKEVSQAELKERETRISEMPTAPQPAEVKKVRGETVIPPSERPLTPKPTGEPEPTPGQQARRQAGRLPRGTSGTGTFTFQTATRPEGVTGIKTIRDIARQSQKGRSISPLSPQVQGTALALARRDHEIAKTSGKEVNGISPNAVTPDEVSIRGTHHERLAEVIHGYGAKEEDFNKLPGKGDLPTKVSFAWSAMKEHERSKRKTPLWHESEGATHWEDPRTKQVKALALGGHPEFYRHEGSTESLIRGRGESNWKPVTPTTEGWHVINLRGQKTWTFRGHPAEPYKDTHQVRSLFQHVQNTVKGEFPEAPIRSITDSGDSRRRAAERVREKFIVMKPEAAEASMFSKRATKDSGFLRQRGRTKRTLVAGDNVTVENTPETEFVTGPKRIEPRRPKVVQEPSGRRVVRPRRRDESKKVGFISQPLAVSKQMTKPGMPSMQPPSVTKLGPSGEILRSAPSITKEIVPDPKALKKNPKTKKTKAVYSVKPGMVDQPFPSMEKYGYEKPATPAKKVTTKKLIPVEGPITAGQAEAESTTRYTPSSGELRKLVGRPSITVSKETTIPGTPAVRGSARPTPQGEYAGETGIEQLQYYKKKSGGVIPSTSRELVKAPKKQPRPKAAKPSTILSGTDLAATRNIPQQLELPGIESPGYAGAMGQQFRRVSQKTRELQLKSQQGAVPGVAAEMPRGTEPKKSTRSFKGRR
jgi:hypothetical protein